MQVKEKEDIRRFVQEHYGKIAVRGTSQPGCCTPAGDSAEASNSPCCDGEYDAASLGVIADRIGYKTVDISDVPDESNLGLGCGNPQAIAALQTGEQVLDLGSGAGFDCFLAAKQVGDSGFVIGVDMTPEMIGKASENAAKGDYPNVEFRLGEIEHLPVPDASIDVIISNCVINLSPDKPQVFQEAFRVLKPGGRLAIADIVATADMPDELKADMALYTGCVSGASTISALEEMLKDAGFERIQINPKDESKALIREWLPGISAEQLIVSANIQAIKAY